MHINWRRGENREQVYHLEGIERRRRPRRYTRIAKRYLTRIVRRNRENEHPVIRRCIDWLIR